MLKYWILDTQYLVDPFPESCLCSSAGRALIMRAVDRGVRLPIKAKDEGPEIFFRLMDNAKT